MADFLIQVIIEPSSAATGARKVRGELEKVESSADKLSRTLRRTFAGVGAALVLRELQQLTDAYTNAQNRIRTVVASEVELAEVTTELFEIANRTRTAFEGSAEAFARVASAAKELGVTQKDVLQFTESLNQAIVLSGASAAEAQAGMIQLAQGISSGALRGDELRSVLEQLPAVADVIAKSLGVTRGQLRKLGEDGKITAGVILSAFEQAREELDERFAKTVPTVGQAFVVLRNNLLQFIGEQDKALGVSEAFSRTILLLAENIDLLAASVFVLAAAALPAMVTAMSSAIAASTTLQAVFARGLFNPVILGAGAAAVAALGLVKVYENQLSNAVAQASREMEAFREAARGTDLNELNTAISNVEKTLARVQEQAAQGLFGPGEAEKRVASLNAKLDELVTQYDALSDGSGRTLAQIREQATAAKNLTTAVDGVIESISRENELLRLNSKEREIQERLIKEITKLQKDGTVVTEDDTRRLEASIRQNQAYEVQAEVLNDLRGPQEELEAKLAAIEELQNTGALRAGEHEQALRQLAEAAEDVDFSKLSGSDDAEALQKRLVAIQETARVEALRAKVLADILGPTQELADTERILAEERDKGKISTEQYTAALTKAREELKPLTTEQQAQKDLLEELNAPVTKAVARFQALHQLFVQGRVNIEQYNAEVAKIKDSLPKNELQQLVEELNKPTEELLRRQELLNQAYADTSINARTYAEESRRIAEALEPLTEQEQLRTDLYQQITGNAQQFIDVQRELGVLFANDAINAEQYAAALNNIAIAQNTIGSGAAAGAAAGLAQIQNELIDVGGTVQASIVNSFHEAQDALLNFTKTGELAFDDFVTSVLDGLRQIAIQKVLQSLFSFLPGGGAAAAAGSVLPRASGGPVSAGRSYLVGERGPELFTPPQAGKIVPAGETAARLQASSSPQVNVSAPPATVNVINVTDPNEIAGEIARPGGAGEQAVMNVITRNRRKVKGSIG